MKYILIYGLQLFTFLLFIYNRSHYIQGSFQGSLKHCSSSKTFTGYRVLVPESVFQNFINIYFIWTILYLNEILFKLFTGHLGATKIAERFHLGQQFIRGTEWTTYFSQTASLLPLFHVQL